MTRESLINDFAFRSFRDVADEDYITARLAFRAKLIQPSLWQSQQAIEKYLKCILLLNRIPATRTFHSLRLALQAIEDSGKLSLRLKSISSEFLDEIDAIGTNRYFLLSVVWRRNALFELDRLVWELRRHCTLDKSFSSLELQQGVIPTQYRLPGGLLEEILDSRDHPGREALVWNNGFWSARRRKTLKFRNHQQFKNAPLYMHPELLDDLLKLVYLPDPLVKGWRLHRAPGYAVPPDTMEPQQI